MHWKKQLTIPLGLSQAFQVFEIYDIKITTGVTQNNNQLPENDGTAFVKKSLLKSICLKIPEKSFELQPVSDEEIAGTFILASLSTFSLMTF